MLKRAIHDRSENEIRLLSLLYQNRSMAKAELARALGLSATASGKIISKLETDEFVLKGKPVKGRIGQPSTPYRINPESTYSFGLDINRKNSKLFLINALFEVVDSKSISYDHPDMDQIIDCVTKYSQMLLEKNGLSGTDRVAALGIAMPFQIWKWSDILHVQPGAMNHWEHRDIAQELDNALPWDIYLYNDATAACCAELTLHNPLGVANFVYFFIDWFIRGGVVLNNAILEGPFLNAGALGSMPVQNTNNQTVQLQEAASLYPLEEALESKGLDKHLLWLDQFNEWHLLGNELEDWMNEAAYALAQAALTASSVIDFEAAIIASGLPDDIHYAIVDKTKEHYRKLNQSGLIPLQIESGGIGGLARVRGAAALPLFDIFKNNNEMLKISKTDNQL